MASADSTVVAAKKAMKEIKKTVQEMNRPQLLRKLGLVCDRRMASRDSVSEVDAKNRKLEGSFSTQKRCRRVITVHRWQGSGIKPLQLNDSRRS